MTHNYLIESNSTDPFYNLALEEYLLTKYGTGNIILLWQNDSTVVVGKNQNVPEEIDLDYVRKNNIQIVRRMTGGGAVYHDLGNLNYSLITDYQESEEKNDLRNFAIPIIDTLHEFGAIARFSGRNDILIEEKKISGTAQRIYKNRILHHGCLLITSDLKKLEKCLKPKKDKYHSKSVKSVRSRVANVSDFVNSSITVQDFRNQLICNMQKNMHYEPLELTEEDISNVKMLREHKYTTWEWNYGQPRKCQIHNRQRFSAGEIEVFLESKNGKISQIKFRGDYMARSDTNEIERALTGISYRYTDILQALNHFSLYNYFGEITTEELTTLICEKTID